MDGAFSLWWFVPRFWTFAVKSCQHFVPTEQTDGSGNVAVKVRGFELSKYLCVLVCLLNDFWQKSSSERCVKFQFHGKLRMVRTMKYCKHFDSRFYRPIIFLFVRQISWKYLTDIISIYLTECTSLNTPDFNRMKLICKIISGKDSPLNGFFCG